MPDKTINITWYVEDGYTTGDRPQGTKVFVDDFYSEMTDYDIEQIIYAYVDEEISERIHAEIPDIEDIIKKIREAL